MSERQPDQKIPPNHMKVTSRGDALKYIGYGNYILTKTDYKDLIIIGTGSSIAVAIKVAEQLRQEVKGIHSIHEITSI